MTCEYSRPEQIHASAPVSNQLWNDYRVGHDDTNVQSIGFPTLLFLDPGLLQHGQIEVPHAAVPVSAHVLHLLGDLNDIRVTASRFFEHIHLWMPFIAKKRFYDLYLRPSFQSRPDIVLLLLSLKLIMTLSPQIRAILRLPCIMP